jgi:hypothetical protein
MADFLRADIQQDESAILESLKRFADATRDNIPTGAPPGNVLALFDTARNLSVY